MIRNLFELTRDSYLWVSLQNFPHHAQAWTLQLQFQGFPNSNICCKVQKTEGVKLLSIFATLCIKLRCTAARQGKLNVHVKAFGWEYWDPVNSFFYSMNISNMVASFGPVQVIYIFWFKICEGNEISNLRLIFSILITVGSVHCNLVEQVLGGYEASRPFKFNARDFTKGSLWHTFQAWRQVAASLLNQWRNEGVQVICYWQKCLWNLPYLREETMLQIYIVLW